jgi:hypothetical protein
MAEKTVTRSNGEQVRLRLWRVDRSRQRVGIDIPRYNARFIFTQTGKDIRILSDRDRRQLNPELPVISHVSKQVYNAMALWAGSILNNPRSKGA